ncbi:MAG: hypothetical protein AAFP76_11750 [Bacteroidota bacterium]
MCRYAMTSYKPHFACFSCRKSFKRRLLRDIEGGHSDSYEKVPAKCPECGELMANMGLDFKAPKKADSKAWSHLKNLYNVGIAFHSCGCSGPGYVPRDISELVKHFEQIKEGYLEHQQFWARREGDPIGQSAVVKDLHKNSTYLYSIPNKLKSGSRNKPRYDSTKAQIYWNERVKGIEDKIAYLTNTNNV